MKSEQVNVRLEVTQIRRIEQAAELESLDRAAMMRKLLDEGLRLWWVDEALRRYADGSWSAEHAAQQAGISLWDLQEHMKSRGYAYPFTTGDVTARLRELRQEVGEKTPAYAASLPDLPCRPGGILFVGVNPSPISARRGHYYQGVHGRRFWARVLRLGLASRLVPGREDEALVQAGHGFTDLVSRPTRRVSDLAGDEIRAGVEALREKVRRWRPGLVVFVYQRAARATHGRGSTAVGPGPSFESVPTFLLTGPYAKRSDREENDRKLLEVLGGGPMAHTQRITEADLAAGRIRLPRPAKEFFPPRVGEVTLWIRGARFQARYDPRTGPDRERSAILQIGPELRRLVRPDERLTVRAREGGQVELV